MANIRGLLFLLALLPVQAIAISVQVLEIAPSAGIRLGAGQPLYLRLAYQSDQPLRFQVRPLGTEPDMVNAAPVHPAGAGEALVWLAFRQPRAIDGVMVRYYNQHWTLLGEQMVPIRAEWRGGVIKAGTEPDWVRELNERDQQMTREAIQRSQHDTDVSGSFLIALMAWSVPGYLLLQWLVIKRWRDKWRLPGLFPLWVSLPVLGWTLVALLAGSNLWPLVMLFVLPVLFLYLVLLSLARKLSNRG